jgi:tyrosinase
MVKIAVASREVNGAPLKIRQNISHMTPDEVARLGAAIAEVQARRDNRGFQFFAGWHGVPFGICLHHEPLFLSWHRGYLYHFELALQDVDAQVTLPWWDWMNEAGVPAAYQEAPLDSMPIEPYGIAREPGWPERTTRDPGGFRPNLPQQPLPPPLNDHPPSPDVLREDWIVKLASSFTEMRRRLEMVHDNIHVWVGGEMLDPWWAAYDPLFWAHHTQVDRLWRIWQHHHPGGRLTDEELETPLTFASPPSMKARDLEDVKSLGYDYAGTVHAAPGPG